MSLKIYGIIVCSKCKRSWGINLSQKTSKCPQCGKKNNVSQRKIPYQTLDLKDLQKAIARIQEKITKSSY
jgi:anaerobic ribonucleoside-triphosphate reductase